MKIKKTRHLCTAPRVAEILGVIKQTVYYWIKKGWTAEPGMDYKNQKIFTKVELE